MDRFWNVVSSGVPTAPSHWQASTPNLPKWSMAFEAACGAAASGEHVLFRKQSLDRRRQGSIVAAGCLTSTVWLGAVGPQRSWTNSGFVPSNARTTSTLLSSIIKSSTIWRGVRSRGHDECSMDKVMRQLVPRAKTDSAGYTTPEVSPGAFLVRASHATHSCNSNDHNHSKVDKLTLNLGRNMGADSSIPRVPPRSPLCSLEDHESLLLG